MTAKQMQRKHRYMGSIRKLVTASDVPLSGKARLQGKLADTKSVTLLHPLSTLTGLGRCIRAVIGQRNASERPDAAHETTRVMRRTGSALFPGNNLALAASECNAGDRDVDSPGSALQSRPSTGSTHRAIRGRPSRPIFRCR